MIVAVYPGSFDPVTLGHTDIIQRAARVFDQVIVALLENPNKKPLFTRQERLSMLSEATRELPNVSVESFRGLLVDYLRSRGVKVVVKGLRAVSDFEFELQQALTNRRLDPEIETFFMMSDSAHAFLSSSLIKEIVRFGGSVHDFVPHGVEEQLKRRLIEIGADAFGETISG
ncbi:MAG: pantetheine-phosphate adenylyltransferase [Firmicutes bacterium]|nr:pantetheine-phosphate adenylyltransferase [Bacillota bacterium]